MSLKENEKYTGREEGCSNQRKALNYTDSFRLNSGGAVPPNLSSECPHAQGFEHMPLALAAL